MKLGVVALIACSFLLSAAPARAGWQIDRAQQVAAAVYPNQCPQVQVRWSAEPPAQPDSAQVAGWITSEPCVVYFSQRVHHEWWSLCHTMIHEYGHLIGLGHTSDPGSPMYAGRKWVDETDRAVTSTSQRERVVSLRGSDVDMRCFDRGRDFLGMRSADYGWN